MAWRGGFSGVGFDRAEFRKWLRTQEKPPYHRIVNHMTDAPYTRAPVPCSQRIRNLGNYYQNDLKWSGGPDFFVLGDGKVYLGSPMGYSIGCKGWNGNSFHVECEGRYNGKTHDFKSGRGLENWKTIAWVEAELIDWMGWKADGERIKLHKEGNTGHNCPGVVPKDWIISLIKEALGVTTTETGGVHIPKQTFDVRTIQERLLVHGYKLPKWGADGIMGKETKAAIMEMQKALNIAPSGLVGPWLWGQLLKDPPAKAVPKQPDPGPDMEPTPVIKPEPYQPIVAPGQPEPNPAKAMRLLQTVAGWPKHWAAGAVAQAQRESYPDLRPWAKGDWLLDGKPVPRGTPEAEPTAFGIWQLRNDRWDNYLSWVELRGKPWDDFESQVLWCPHELKTSEKLAWKWLQKAATVEQACAAMVWYERPKGYISSKAKAALTWEEVFAVSEKCDGWEVRLKFAKALV